MSGPTSNRVQVQKYRVSNQPVSVDTNATQGAQIGVNLWDSSGNLITQDQWNALSSTSTSTVSGTTDDVNEGQWNLYFTIPRAQDAVGSILENSSNVTLEYVSHTSIKADLTMVTVGSGGTLQKYGFDVYGRLSEQETATTDNLVEGSTNLYYTNARVDAEIGTMKGVPNGLATLDASGKLTGSQVPAIAVNETYVVASQAAMLALSANVGDTAVRTDISETFILQATPASTLSNWVQLLFPTGGVTSFNGRTGAVVPASGDYTFSQLSGTASTTQGGTGLTSYAIGDVVYGSNINTLSALAGNTTTTRKFLRQTGTGIASAAPAWDTLVAGDIPALSYISSTVTRAANTALMGPTSGSSGVPTFRSPVLADLSTALPPGYIDGFQLIWNSVSSISVTSGVCMLPNGNMLNSTSNLTLSSLTGLTASTFYHVYAYNNAGTPGIECVSTAPAAPYNGTARSKSSDTSRRYLGSVLTNSSSQIFWFSHHASKIFYGWGDAGLPPQRPLNSGTATIATTVDLSMGIPISASVALLRFVNSDISVGSRIGNSSIPGVSGSSGSGTNFYAAAAPNTTTVFDCPTDANQQIMYWLTSTSTGGGLSIDIFGYIYDR